MRPLIFIYTHDDVFEGVKQESSQFSVRRADESGNGLFEQFVFDEGYLSKFRELFFDAQSDVLPALSRYAREIGSGGGCFETQDFTKNRDFMFCLDMPDDFAYSIKNAVYLKLKQYFIAYIMYRWLETKLPDVAAVFYERATESLMRAKSLLERRTKPIRRKHRMW